MLNLYCRFFTRNYIVRCKSNLIQLFFRQCVLFWMLHNNIWAFLIVKFHKDYLFHDNREVAKNNNIS